MNDAQLSQAIGLLTKAILAGTEENSMLADMAKISAISQRAAAATPGPWQVIWDTRPDIVTETGKGGYYGEGHIATVSKYDEWGGMPGNDADATFIAAAREDIPFLLQAYGRAATRSEQLLGLLLLRGKEAPAWTDEIIAARADDMAIEFTQAYAGQGAWALDSPLYRRLVALLAQAIREGSNPPTGNEVAS